MSGPGAGEVPAGTAGVLDAARAIVEREIVSGTDWAGTADISCSECGCEFPVTDYVQHLRDPDRIHAPVRAVQMIAREAQRARPDLGPANLRRIADQSGTSLGFVERLVRDNYQG